MSVVINGTTGISGVDGSAGTPAVQGTDSNTGIVFPAADTVAIGTGGSERMRVDSSGNVGIGNTVASTINSGNGVGNLVVGSGSGSKGITIYTGTTDTGGLAFADGTTTTDTYRGYINYAHNTDHMAFWTSATERMRVDSSGNVGIGLTSPSIYGQGGKHLTVSNTTSNGYSYLNLAGTSTGGGEIDFGDQTIRHAAIASLNGSALAFYTNNSNSGTTVAERMRITSGGEVYIAGTGDQGAYNLQCNGTGVWGAGAYVNGSDARIKEDVAPITSGLDVVTKLNPVTYRYKPDWTKDQSTQTGFIAQELLVALEGQNYVDGVVQQGGVEGYYSVAYQNIIPILTKAIQELSTKLDEANARIAALEAK